MCRTPNALCLPAVLALPLLDSLIDYIAVSGTMERNVLEFVDHLHEHFLYPCSINKNGRYNVPSNAQEGYRSVSSATIAFPVLSLTHGLALARPVSRCTRRASPSMSIPTAHIGRAVHRDDRKHGGPEPKKEENDNHVLVHLQSDVHHVSSAQCTMHGMVSTAAAPRPSFARCARKQ